MVQYCTRLEIYAAEENVRNGVLCGKTNPAHSTNKYASVV